MLHFMELYCIMQFSQAILKFSESQRLSAVNMPNHRGKTVLHEAIRANNPECVHTLLATYPESELLPAAIMQDNEGRTVLHYLAREHNLSGIKLQAMLRVSRRFCHSIQSRNDYPQVRKYSYSNNKSIM